MYAELERRCTKCKKVKLLTKFTKRSDRPSGKACWCKGCLNEWRRKDKEGRKEHYERYEFQRSLKRYYGITVDHYERMLAQQKGRCACCGQHQSMFKRRLHVDHCHETGEIRGLLCTQCNPGIGYLQHSIPRLKKAILYLSKFKK